MVTALQKDEHWIIRGHGQEVRVCWDFVNEAKRVIDD